MGMHIVVCVKQVPDSSQIRVHPVTNTIMRQGVPAVVNPYDLVSLEEALRIKDRFGARVTVLSMGPKMAVEALKKILSFGADDAISSPTACSPGPTRWRSYALVGDPHDRRRPSDRHGVPAASRRSTATPRRWARAWRASACSS